MIKKIKKAIVPFRKLMYQIRGNRPWSYGYLDKRWEIIFNSIRNESILQTFASNQTPASFGIGFDERIVEYPWIFSQLNKTEGTRLLDAGSTFNYAEIITHPILTNKDLSIYTFYPEGINFIERRVSYQFGDLRLLPYHTNWFDQVICQSTIEHVDMDNSIYGYELAQIKDKTAKSYEYLTVISELIRVVKPGGSILLTFPFGVFENHDFFQQFDSEMVGRMTSLFQSSGTFSKSFITYHKEGWQFVSETECSDSKSYNPHTGKGKGDDGAAHSRTVCCIAFIKHN